jgi:hypothetical protein
MDLSSKNTDSRYSRKNTGNGLPKTQDFFLLTIRKDMNILIHLGYILTFRMHINGILLQDLVVIIQTLHNDGKSLSSKPQRNTGFLHFKRNTL